MGIFVIGAKLHLQHVLSLGYLAGYCLAQIFSGRLFQISIFDQNCKHRRMIDQCEEQEPGTEEGQSRKVLVEGFWCQRAVLNIDESYADFYFTGGLFIVNI